MSDRRRHVVAGGNNIAKTRRPSGIGDEQFLRSMIPHHGGAILKCEQASLRDPGESRRCAESIVSSQQREIDLMKASWRAGGVRRARPRVQSRSAAGAVVPVS